MGAYRCQGHHSSSGRRNTLNQIIHLANTAVQKLILRGILSRSQQKRQTHLNCWLPRSNAHPAKIFCPNIPASSCRAAVEANCARRPCRTLRQQVGLKGPRRGEARSCMKPIHAPQQF